MPTLHASYVGGILLVLVYLVVAPNSLNNKMLKLFLTHLKSLSWVWSWKPCNPSPWEVKAGGS
jgi:hypothetical protein